MNKLNLFSALTAPRPLTFFSSLSKIDEVPLVANLGRTSLAKRTARSISPILPKLPIILPINTPNLIILVN